MHAFVLIALVLALAAVPALAQAPRPPRLFLENPRDLLFNAQKSVTGEDPFRTYLRWLSEDAEESFALPIVRVGTAKYRPPDAKWNDFISMAPYWWPDPSKPNGLPYMKRDGYVNPEVNEYPDKGYLVVNVGDGTINLAYAWYMARMVPGAFPRGADEYARKAIRQLRTWFVDPNTRMAPNMQFAQIRPGYRIDPDDGATGILDFSREIRLVEAISMLSSHPAWDAAMTAGMRTWMSQFLSWLETSPSGLRAKGAGNNIGIYYDGLVAIIKLYLRRGDAARFIRRACTARVNSQVLASGQMPAETGRPDSMHYTFFALNGLLKLALLSDRVQRGNRYGAGACWRNPRFRAAMAYPLRAALSENPADWPHNIGGTRGFRPERGWELYYASWLAYGNTREKFGDAAWKWNRQGGVGKWGRVFYPEPSTRASVVGRTWRTMFGLAANSIGGLPVGNSNRTSAAPADLCHGLVCKPFTMEDGTVIYAATEIDDYGM